MYPFRNIHRKGWMFRLPALAVILCSLIAPGFMLDSSADDGFGFHITLCHGLKRINAVKGMESGPHAHPGSHTGMGDDEREGDYSPVHFTAACGLWTASGTFIEAPARDAGRYLETVCSVRILEPAVTCIDAPYKHVQQARAPPAVPVI